MNKQNPQTGTTNQNPKEGRGADNRQFSQRSDQQNNNPAGSKSLKRGNTQGSRNSWSHAG